jgi:hypothetical protein
MITIFKAAYWTSAIIELIVCIARIIIFNMNRSALTASCVAGYTSRYPTDPAAEVEASCGNLINIFLIVFSIVSVLISILEVNV